MGFYNEDIKNNYINENKQSSDVAKKAKSLFVNSAPSELKFNKDIFDFNKEEALELLRNYNQRTMLSLAHIKSRLSTYTNWAIKKGLTKSNQNVWTALEIDSKMIVDKASNTLIKDRKEFIKLIDKYCDHAYRRLVLLMLYEGCMGREYSEIRFTLDEDLDIENKRLRLLRDGKDFYLPVSREFISAYKASFDFNQFDKKGSPYLIKNRVKGKALSKNVINHYVQHFANAIAKETGNKPEYTAVSIWKSGMYNYILDKERVYGYITNDILSDASKMYGYNIDELSLLRREYNLYKDAFKF